MDWHGDVTFFSKEHAKKFQSAIMSLKFLFYNLFKYKQGAYISLQNTYKSHLKYFQF
jgi:hypothetical protein